MSDVPSAGQTGQTVATSSGSGANLRSTHPLDLLSREFDDVCTGASDPLEIAANLEAEGFGDETARLRYGAPNVFELADELFHRVPLRDRKSRHEAPELTPDRPSQQLMRGFALAVPAITAALLSSITTIDSVVTASLLAAAVLGWGLSQALSYLGYQLTGSLDHEGARRFFRTVLVPGILFIAVLAVVTSWAIGEMVAAPVFVATTMYVVVVSVLVIFRYEIWLLSFLLAGSAAVLGGALFLSSTASDVVMIAGASGAIGACYVLALIACRSRSGKRPWPSIGRPALRTAGCLATIGWVWAAITLAGVAASDNGDVPTSLAILPILLALGVAEWQLSQFRTDARAALRLGRDVVAYRRFVRAAFDESTLYYLSALALGSVAVGALTWETYGSAVIVPLLASIVLGLAFYAGLVLLSFVEWLPVLVASLAALVFIEVLSIPLLGIDSEVQLVLGRVFLLAVLFVIARRMIIRSMLHR